jgi:hypothetical protein
MQEELLQFVNDANERNDRQAVTKKQPEWLKQGGHRNTYTFSKVPPSPAGKVIHPRSCSAGAHLRPLALPVMAFVGSHCCM